MAGAKVRAKRGGPALTERERYWLRQHEACAASGEPAKAYAKRQGLSIHALYQSRKRLRAIGALAPAAPARRGRTPAAKRPEAPRVSFTKLGAVAAMAAASPRYRVRLANGASLEWDGPVVATELEALLGVVGHLS